MRRYIAALLSAIFALSLVSCAKEKLPEKIIYEDIAIVYTNDIHCAIEENIGLSAVAALKDELVSEGKTVILADVGDAVQGKAIGMMSDGKYIVDIMNEVGYDIATFGNHEFDYGIKALKHLVSEAKFSYVCTNANIGGELLVKPYKIFETGERKIAFVGITTPSTLLTSPPNIFYDENTNEFANFMGGGNGEFLYEAVQKAVDDARAEGADYVIALSHLGSEAQCFPWRAEDVIENTAGIDVFLDAHEHSVIESEFIKNKKNEDVIRTSTGTRLQNIGILSISPDGTISTSHVKPSSKSKKVDLFINEIKNEYDEEISVKICESEASLYSSDSESGEKTIRKAESGLGNFVADAMREATLSDVAIINGGSITGSIEKGDISYADICKIFRSEENVISIKVTGEQLADALEYGARNLPDEMSSFLQVSGMSFEVDTSISSKVKITGERSFAGIDDQRRVKNIKIGGEDIDFSSEYILTGTDYILKDFSVGFNMFKGCETVSDDGIPVSLALRDYILNSLSGKIGAEYEKTGERIIIK